MVVYEKKEIILERADLHWNIPSLLRDTPDIHGFPVMHMVMIHFLLENL